MKPFYRKASSGEYGTGSLVRNGPVYSVADVMTGKDGQLFNSRGNPLAPTEEFVAPQPAEDKELPYTGRLRQRRAPEDLQR
jgi:hypothetical protein